MLSNCASQFARAFILVLASTSLALAADGASVQSTTVHKIEPSHSTAYTRYCSWCHGVEGDGDGASAHRFDVPATDFTRGVYKCRSTPSGAPPSEGDIRRSIREGLSSTGMPSFRAISGPEAEEIVAYLRTLIPPAVVAASAQPIDIPPETANDEASVQRGAATYARLKCDLCHGKDGRGGPNARKSANDNGTPAQAPRLTDSRVFKCGSSPTRLYSTIMTGLDGTPMAGYSEVATPEDVWDVVHFVKTFSTARGFAKE